MTLDGDETEADKKVVAAVEDWFGKKVVYFKALVQPIPETQDGYWHIRLSGETEAIFVRENGIGNIFVYGPSEQRWINYCVI